MDQTNDLALWPILRRVPEEYQILIERFYIFNKGESVLLFCRNGKVYGYGQNQYGMLGIHHDDLREKYLNVIRFHCYHTYSCWDHPRELIKLRYQNVISISKGEKHIMALTDLGDLYGWGANNSGQLGLGWYRTCSLEPTLILQDVKKVCCGPKHTVALIHDGSVRLWGKVPGCAQHFTPEIWIRPPIWMIDLITTKFLTVSYNNQFDEQDKSAFYVWGNLKHFGLLGSSSMVRFTYRRSDYNKIFKIIPIGLNKILVLTQEGQVSLISINNERVRSIRHPFKSVSFINYCIDINEDCNVAILRDRNGQCYIWDERRASGDNLSVIKQRHLSSISDVACLYSSAYTPQITRLPPELLEKEQFNMKKNEMKRKLFNDPKNSDLVFRITRYCCKPIFVHRSVLMAHSEYFKFKLSNLCDENEAFGSWINGFINNNSCNRSTILIDDNSYISMFYYLRYIYTKQIPLTQMDNSLLAELYDISAKFADNALMQMIIDHLHQYPLDGH